MAGEEIGDKEPMQTRTSGGRDFQENILVRLVDGRDVATIYLRNRMSLRGRILEYDAYVLLLEPLDGSPPQMVYKSAVVSVSGLRPERRPSGRGPGGHRPRPDGGRPEGGRPYAGQRPFAPPAPQRPDGGQRAPDAGPAPDATSP